MSIWSYFVVPFVWIMQQCMNLLNNYALALVAYALITKIVLFPLAMKQQKSSLGMVRLKPFQDALAKKYGSNRTKYNMELQKLYEKEGYNPMGSCLPTLIQLPLLLLIYAIVRHPITYVYYKEYFTTNTAQRIFDLANRVGFSNFSESVQKVLTKIAEGTAKLTSVSNFELQIYNKASEIHIPGDKLFGLIDLSGTPSTQFWSWMLLIPIFAGITGFILSILSQKLSPMQQNTDPASQSTSKIMMYTMPLMSLFFSYTLNCALGLYWIITNILSIGQLYILNKIYDPQKALAEVNERMEREKQLNKEKRSAAASKKAAAIAASKKKKK